MISSKCLRRCLFAAGLLACGAGAAAGSRSWTQQLADADAWRDQAHWRLALSPHTEHFRESTEHRHVWAVGLERHRQDGWLLGASRFSNSFGQPSAYVYVGRRFNGLLDQPSLFGQISGGLLYGYKGKFEDKVPLNNNGFSPGALVSIGSQFTRQASVVAHFLGDAGVMLQVSWDFR